MQIDISTMREGDSPHVGKIFWVCDYRRPDLDKKPQRNVVPTQVRLINHKENERVNYSDNYFVRVEGAKTPIKLFDNTGYRWFAGNPLLVFTTEKECIKAFAEQCLDIETRLQERIDHVVQDLKKSKDELTSLREKFQAL